MNQTTLASSKPRIAQNFILGYEIVYYERIPFHETNYIFSIFFLNDKMSFYVTPIKSEGPFFLYR